MADAAGDNPPSPEVDYRAEVYDGDAADLIDLIQGVDDAVNTVMIIGHNPSVSVAVRAARPGQGRSTCAPAASRRTATRDRGTSAVPATRRCWRPTPPAAEVTGRGTGARRAAGHVAAGRLPTRLAARADQCVRRPIPELVLTHDPRGLRHRRAAASAPAVVAWARAWRLPLRARELWLLHARPVRVLVGPGPGATVLFRGGPAVGGLGAAGRRRGFPAGLARRLPGRRDRAGRRRERGQRRRWALRHLGADRDDHHRPGRRRRDERGRVAEVVAGQGVADRAGAGADRGQDGQRRGHRQQSAR